MLSGRGMTVRRRGVRGVIRKRGGGGVMFEGEEVEVLSGGGGGVLSGGGGGVSSGEGMAGRGRGSDRYQRRRRCYQGEEEEVLSGGGVGAVIIGGTVIRR